MSIQDELLAALEAENRRLIQMLEDRAQFIPPGSGIRIHFMGPDEREIAWTDVDCLYPAPGQHAAVFVKAPPVFDMFGAQVIGKPPGGDESNHE